MTALVGASVLLIAASAIALVAGWITADESLIWTSIGASVAAAVALALAYFRARKGDTGTIAAEAAVVPAAEETAASKTAEAHPAEPRTATSESKPKPHAGAEPEPRAATPRPSKPRPAAAGSPANKDSAVAGVPGRKRFHRTDCRYATAKTAKTMTRGDAVDQGYEPCAICKP